MSGPKRYGLIIPKKDGKLSGIKSSIFEQSSDTEENEASDFTANIILPVRTQKKDIILKKQAQLDIEKALSEDPTVFDYDSVYDDMKVKKELQNKQKKCEDDQKPKYIGNLLKAAEQRKKEYDRRMEKKIQKERENEKDTFQDKEQFVTSAYKKKMLEMQEAEELERRQAAIEAAQDVTKQRDLSGFYRHLWKEGTSDIKESNQVRNSSDKPSSVANTSTSISKKDSSKSSQFEAQNTKIKLEQTASASSMSLKEKADLARRAVHNDNNSKQSKEPLTNTSNKSTKSESVEPHELAQISSLSKPVKPNDQTNEFPDDRDFSSSSESSAESEDDEKEVKHTVHKQQTDSKSEAKSNHSTSHKNTEDNEMSIQKSKDDLVSLQQARKDSHEEHSETRKRTDKQELTDNKAKDNANLKFAKRNVGDSIDDARARYLARKQTRHVPVGRESDD